MFVEPQSVLKTGVAQRSSQEEIWNKSEEYDKWRERKNLGFIHLTLPNVNDVPWQGAALTLALASGWALSSSDQVAKLVLDVGEHLAIAIATMLAQPRNDSLNLQLLAFDECRGESKAMIATFG